MTRCRPSKWLPWSILGAGLPLLAAWWLQSGTITGDIATRASKSVSADESTAWAKVETDGRDATLSGTAESQEAVDAAVKAVAGTYGIRTVANLAQIVEPVKLTAPTAESITSTTATPEIKGTWQEGVAKTLAVTVNGTTYKLGENPELTTLAGNWTLKLPAPLASGTYDVTAEVSDGKSLTLAAESPGKLVISLPEPLAAPTAAPYMGNSATPTLTGTWPEGKAASLSVKVGPDSYTLGTNPELTSDGQGNWTLALSKPLPEGTVDIVPTVTDAQGATTSAAAHANALVDLTPPAAASVAAAAAGTAWPFSLNGTWPEERGASLSAKLADQTYVANKDAALTTDGKGAFTFTPPATLAPGSYDVDFTVNDAAGNATLAKSQFTVPEPAVAPIPEPVPEPAPAPEPVAKAPEPAPAPAPVVAMQAPTVDKQLALTGAPIVKGTWPQAVAKGLAVTLGTRTYTLGADANLQSRDGKWSLLPAASLKDGIYDVVVDAFAADGSKTRDETVAELEVDGELPAAPTVAAVPADANPDALTGTWDEKGSTALKVSVPEANITADLGAPNSPLTSDGEGNWTLKLAQKLAPGTYNVIAQSTDNRGRVQEDAGQGDLVIAAPAVVAPPAPPAKDCAAELATVDQSFPVRFSFKRTKLLPPYDTALSHYVDLLKDPGCSTIKVEVAGHTDYFGPRAYNQLLSEGRALKVIELLTAAGIDPSRLSVKAYSEDSPLDPARTRDARMKNRRVEITVLK